MFVTPKDWFLLTALILFIATAISWISFTRFTMTRIEKKIAEKGEINLFEGDSVGIHTIFYAYAIVLPERYAIRLEKRLIKSSLVRSYATNVDKISGIFFLVSSNLFVLTCFSGWLIWS